MVNPTYTLMACGCMQPQALSHSRHCLSASKPHACSWPGLLQVGVLQSLSCQPPHPSCSHTTIRMVSNLHHNCRWLPLVQGVTRRSAGQPSPQHGQPNTDATGPGFQCLVNSISTHTTCRWYNTPLPGSTAGMQAQHPIQPPGGNQEGTRPAALLPHTVSNTPTGRQTTPAAQVWACQDRVQPA
jgi:hypothetical protein